MYITKTHVQYEHIGDEEDGHSSARNSVCATCFPDAALTTPVETTFAVNICTQMEGFQQVDMLGQRP